MVSSWHKLHYNAVAKEIREHWPKEPRQNLPMSSYVGERIQQLHEATALTRLALSFAKRFAVDNPEFKPLVFLDQCSPDPDIYPLSELWEENG